MSGSVCEGADAVHAVDVQLDLFWFLGCASAGDGTSRLVAYGRSDSFADAVGVTRIRQQQGEFLVSQISD